MSKSTVVLTSAISSNTLDQRFDKTLNFTPQFPNVRLKAEQNQWVIGGLVCDLGAKGLQGG
jgi:hypothetical protein